MPRPKAMPRPATYRMDIPGWRPALINDLVGRHPMAIHKRKGRDLKQVATACLVFGVPKATTRRRVRLTISGRYGRFPDDDSPFKSVLDALVRCGALVDDSREWCECDEPRFVRGPRFTVIELEDIPCA
jgi:hypothetical protein